MRRTVLAHRKQLRTIVRVYSSCAVTEELYEGFGMYALEPCFVTCIVRRSFFISDFARLCTTDDAQKYIPHYKARSLTLALISLASSEFVFGVRGFYALIQRHTLTYLRPTSCSFCFFLSVTTGRERCRWQLLKRPRSDKDIGNDNVSKRQKL